MFRQQLPAGRPELAFPRRARGEPVETGPPRRFGSFEIFKAEDEHTGRAGPSVGRNDIRVQLLDYVIGTFYPDIQATHASDSVQRNAAFFREVGPEGQPARPGPGLRPGQPSFRWRWAPARLPPSLAHARRGPPLSVSAVQPGRGGGHSRLRGVRGGTVGPSSLGSLWGEAGFCLTK